MWSVITTRWIVDIPRLLQKQLQDKLCPSWGRCCHRRSSKFEFSVSWARSCQFNLHGASGSTFSWPGSTSPQTRSVTPPRSPDWRFGWSSNPSQFPRPCSSFGARLEANQRVELITFLMEHHDCFAWSHTDMTGIDPSIITHQFWVDPEHVPVKQKRKTGYSLWSRSRSSLWEFVTLLGLNSWEFSVEFRTRAQSLMFKK